MSRIIRSAVELLTARSGDPAIKQCSDVIGRQVSHMGRLLDDLLDISRLSRSTMTLERTGVLVRDIIDAALEISRPSIEGRRHRVHVEGLDAPVMLDADPVRLTQVFGNLLNNAAKYSDPESTIRIAVRRTDSDVEIRVEDRGIGIPTALLGHVFELFARTDAARGRAPGGLGIGLALARSIVELHGGTIEATSHGAGSGSTFTVRLPVAPGEPVPVVSPGTVPKLDVRPRVLVVDDNRDAADMAVMLLERLGCDAHAAYDGESALSELPTFQPALILLDIGLPGIDGYETCRRIRARGMTGTRIVALTGWGTAEDRRRTAAAGFDTHLVKPVGTDALVRLVEESARSSSRGLSAERDEADRRDETTHPST